MDQRICIKAQSCPSSPSCQHGRPHTPCADCVVRACFVGGQVRCKPYVEKEKDSEVDNADK